MVDILLLNMKYQKQYKFLQVYQEVTSLISNVHDPQLVMDLVVNRLPELLEVDAATIRLLDQATDNFVLGSACGVSDEYLSRTVIDTQEVMNALMEGKPTARKDIDINCEHESCAFISNEGVKSAMSLPILFKGEVTGLLRLLTKKPRDFSEDEINFAMSLAEQVGVTIANSNLFQEMENQVAFFEALLEISKLVNSTLHLDDILSLVVSKLPSICNVEGCTIRLLNTSTNRLELVAHSGVSTEYLHRGSVQQEYAFLKAIEGNPVAIYDAVNDSRVGFHDEIKKEGIRSILAVPIKNEQETIGVLRLLTTQHKVFSANDINFAVAVAQESGNAIDKARLYRKITLLFNQIEEHERFLQTILDSYWAELLVIDRSGRLILANKLFLTHHNYLENEVLGQLYNEIVPWHDDSSCLISDVFTTGKPNTAVQQYGVEKSEKWLEHHQLPIFNDDGDVEFVIESVHDITEKALFEREQLSKIKLEGVVEMAGAAAHEINTPLFTAMGTAQLLVDDLESQTVKDEVEVIIANMKKISELTQKMTEVTGYSSTEYVGETRMFDLNALRDEQ